MSISDRDLVIRRIREDLIGPSEENELLADRPSDVYLTGILFPQFTEIGDEQNESLTSEGGSDDAQTSAADDEVPVDRSMRPASAGLSFAVASAKRDPRVIFTISCGTYSATGAADPGASARRAWQRQPHHVPVEVELKAGVPAIALDSHGLRGLELYIQCTPRSAGDTLVTAALINRNQTKKGEHRESIEGKTFFQVELHVVACEDSRLCPRPSRIPLTDDDSRSADLLYRDVVEFATGHTCSVEWEEGSSVCNWISTAWIPAVSVPAVSSAGHKVFARLRSAGRLEPLSAMWLSQASDEDLRTALTLMAECYGEWIRIQQTRVNALAAQYRSQANRHLGECRKVHERMAEGVEFLVTDEKAATAFRLANRAMAIQRGWTERGDASLTWRPFQLGFILLTLCSLANSSHGDRDVMDLLWFPTGGGKTESYLGITAFLLFYRRLRNTSSASRGAGVAAIMRYTLRLLTTQQFERAAALILACDLLRSGGLLPGTISAQLGTEPFSIGLWVGADSVPNDFVTAEKALRISDPDTPSPAQIRLCPACHEPLVWTADFTRKSIEVRCETAACVLAAKAHLPVWTVDSDVYREKPSLVIGTVDKFAQIVRNPETASLFGLGTPYDAPDLILQDELHLISGPLGTIAGLYEIAIDQLCSREKSRPKIIGSTATIRRAESQISALFNRRTCQFPPPGLDASDSGFAVRDESVPGRVYCGVTTAGRSAKFTLQATCASVLQSPNGLSTNQDRDPYWTLVTYFNSLRELGGALVLMQDDVPRTIEHLARRRAEQPRILEEVKELTSRVTQLEIRDMLGQLGTQAGDPAAVDVLLASNMISVGVDVPRLGLMLVNGQPKGISEYIQATSRVGRGSVAGLILTVYNNGKSRDRSHYETFRTWHCTLYREVEATSVTPFASRARDKALHAALVALVRHLIPEMTNSPVLDPRWEKKVEPFLRYIVLRAGMVDPAERDGVEQDLKQLMSEWRSRIGLKRYWDDYKRQESLLISAEAAAELSACNTAIGDAWPTPNSMRNVEPGTPFALAERLSANLPAPGERRAAHGK